VSFNRVSRKMSLELLDLPLLQNVKACLETNWFRALAISLTLPFLPIFFAVSFVNQSVRRKRGLTRKESSYLTRRVREACQRAASWDWIEVTSWIYIMSAVLLTFRLAPVFLNVLLAWMSSAMANLNFWLICAVTFCTGTFLFMLPPVPGPVIYPFAGVVLSDPEKCPYGFAWGCVISIVLSFVMKMAACAVQQKGIGERLGNSLAVKQACGIHKPMMRAIEAVLKRPGLSWGKCMILCGGPDWPTSVLAGMMHLSLGNHTGARVHRPDGIDW